MKMKVTEYIKNQLATNQAWAVKALVKVYTLQTLDEQVTGQTANCFQEDAPLSQASC